MTTFSGLIDRIFESDENGEPQKKNRKKLAVKNTSSMNPEIAAEKAARRAIAETRKVAAAKASANDIDIARLLDRKAKAHAKSGIKWRTSIVDLMKLCELKTSFNDRKALAEELGYPGKIVPSQAAKMNAWLHQEMMRQIVANGGKLPKTLLK